MGLIAALILPTIPRATSRTRLEGYAVQTAAILKADRNAAQRRGALIATEVSAQVRAIRSGATGLLVQLPQDVGIDTLLASTCAGRETGKTIDFFPSGLSCGGVIALTRPGMRYEIRVNWLTGGVEIVSQQPS